MIGEWHDKLMNRIDVALSEAMIWFIKRDYGANCPTKDTDDFEGEDLSDARCASCRAKEMVEWLEDHVSLLES